MEPDRERCQSWPSRAYVESNPAKVVYRRERCKRRPKFVVACAEAGWAATVCMPCLVRMRNKAIGLFTEYPVEDWKWKG